MNFGSAANKAIIKFLGPHGPDGLLAFVFFTIATGMILKGIDAIVVITLIVLVYGTYALRQTLAERHKERAARIEVEKKDADLRMFREREQAKIVKGAAKAVVAKKERATSGGKST